MSKKINSKSCDDNFNHNEPDTILTTFNAKVEKITKDSDGKRATLLADVRGRALIVEDSKVHSHRSIGEIMDACEKNFGEEMCSSFFSVTFSHENYTKVYTVNSVKEVKYKGKVVLKVELEKLEEVLGAAAKKAADFSHVKKGDNVSMTLIGTKKTDENEEHEEKTVAELVKESGDLSTLETALKAADLDEILDHENAIFTVFAPTDNAFSKLPSGTVAGLLKKKNKEELVSLLKDHVVRGKFTSKELAKKSFVLSLSGKKLKVKNSGSKLMVGGAVIQDADIEASNGVVHTVNNVIM